jgi:hypothetical protein
MAVKDLTPQYDLTSNVYNKDLVAAVYEALRSQHGSNSFRNDLASIQNYGDTLPIAPIA